MGDLSIRIITDGKKEYLPLLLLGDEQEDQIDKYLERGDLFALFDNGLKSVCVVTDEGDKTLEIQNLATDTRYQKRGYASRLIEHMKNHYAGKYDKIILGTGDVPGILSFYKKCGFTITHRIPDYFTTHYNHPIVEDGIILKDKVYLEMKINLSKPKHKPDYSNPIVETANLGTLKDYRFVVVFARYHDKWLYCRAKDRNGFETAGGHIEKGETPLQAARRELYEETGAVEFEIAPAFDYSVEIPTEKSTGQVFFARKLKLGDLPNFEMAEVKLFDSIPDKMRFPGILPVLYRKMQMWLNVQESKDEIWDVYDSERRLTGRTHRRADPMPEGDYHLVVHVWLQNSRGEFLITKRAPNKGYPNMWECTGGSAIAGDDSLAAAVREVKEETGLDVLPENGKVIYTVIRDDSIMDAWLFRQDFDIDDVVLQEGETTDAMYADTDKIRQMIDDGEFIAFHYVEKLFEVARAKTGWERSRRVHFDEIVEKYDKIRWDYPKELFDDIFAYTQPCDNKTALEIGAGTGKATSAFLNAGYTVTAVEMGDNMAAFLADKFNENIKAGKLGIINKTFENAMLDETDYDVVYAASAFHWVDAEIGCPKVYNLLRPGGTFALFRNNANSSADKELFADIQSIYDQYYYSHYTTGKWVSDKTEDDYMKPSEIYNGFRFDSMEKYGFSDVAMKFYRTSQTYSADEYIMLLDTYSDHRELPDDNRDALYAGVHKAIQNHGGFLEMRFLYQLYMGRKPNV